MINQHIHAKVMGPGFAAHPFSGVVEVSFRGRPLILSWQEADTLLNCSVQEWPIWYQIGLFDVQDSCIRTGIHGRNLPVTLREYEELSLALQEAYLRTD